MEDEHLEEKSEETPIEPLEAQVLQKPKKRLTEKQKEQGRANLQKGREALAEKRRVQKEEQLKRVDAMIVKKAEKLVKLNANKEKLITSVIGEIPEDTPDEIEERITKKPKKKRIVYREESDSEEEVIIKTKPKEVKKEPVVVAQKPQTFRINFI